MLAWIVRLRPFWGIATIVAIAALVYGSQLYLEPLWLDETHTAWLIIQPWADFFSRALEDNKPPLYFFIMKLWSSVFGTSEGALRSFSLIAMLGTIVVLYDLVRRLANERVARYSAFLVAISPLAAYLATEARNYGFLMFLGTLTLWCTERAIRENSLRAWLRVSVVTTAVMYTHYLGVFLLPVTLVFVLMRANKQVVTRFIGSQLLAGVAIIPWIPVLLGHVGSSGEGHLAWRTALFDAYTAPVLLHSLLAFMPGGEISVQPLHASIPTLQPILIVLGCGLGGLLVWKNRSRLTARSPITAFALLWLILPLGAMWLVSVLAIPVYTPGRSDTIALPAFSVLVACAITRLRSEKRQRTVLAVLTIAGLGSLFYDATNPTRQSEHTALTKVAEQKPDAVIASWATYAQAKYYIGRVLPNTAILAYPQSFERGPATMSSPVRLPDLHHNARALAASLKGRRRVVLLHVYHPTTGPLREALRKAGFKLHLEDSYQIEGIAVDAYVYRIIPQV